MQIMSLFVNNAKLMYIFDNSIVGTWEKDI